MTSQTRTRAFHWTAVGSWSPSLLALLVLCGAPLAQASDSSLAGHALAELAATTQPAGAGGSADAPHFTLRSEELPAFTDWEAAAGRGAGQVRYSEVTGWLTPQRRSSLGLSLGLVSDQAGVRGGNAPLAYDLGVRWRSRLQERVHLDLHAWSRTPQSLAAHDAMGMIWMREPGQIGTRLEVQWKASRTGGLIPEFGAIGVQLQGDAKLLLRARHGGPMVYYRAKF
ncbi:hypothetical protein [Melaminivora alkalimesophila]|uniref:Uncharacterized protein n=1 Tax=Melaminivora alkalimesophila TaxID=1165852 RepID=A0A317RKQ4_9BURK|nr:hypothetical protein [Melaminivora alkalimesophila]PWW49040.1 hypothetical protein DFR36_101560 [Melaminivora alkalimesophila]